MTPSLIDSAGPVTERRGIDIARLESWLRTHVPGLPPHPMVLEQFGSGYSNLTYLLGFGGHELVMRRPPHGARVKTGHDMDREYRVLSRLFRAFPRAPRAYAFCDDEHVIGAPFYVMERRRGIILRRTFPPGLMPAEVIVRRMCTSLVECLAELHAVDYRTIGLEELGHPEGYVRRQVEGWIGRWRRAETEVIVDIDDIARWLTEYLPADGDATIVHNDYKFDNVVLDVEDPSTITAVLDWEMCTIGDPLMDLGTTLGYWVQADDEPLWKTVAFGPTAVVGASSRQQLAESYARITGRDVSNMLYYYCFALLKIAVIAQQIYVRFLQGHTRDPRFAGLGEVVKTLGKIAVRAAQSGRY